jgi:Transposase DDE domain
LRKLRIGGIGEWDAILPGAKGEGDDLPVRVCAIKKSKEATEQARKKIRRLASKKGHETKPETLESAAYVVILTTAPATRMSAESALELYRARWQVELVFKRMKSIIGLGHLPKVDPESSRAWLHGKLFVALLTETLVHATESLSPWGYPIA